ncbi:MAG: SelB C-terminal domain-containing protein [Actinobacteria bacterium]|nr:SelB C-terminal domain-containing protein [Actinomycetota bacterium]
MFSVARFAELGRRAVELVRDHHTARPLEKGIDRESLRQGLGLGPEVFDGFLARTSILTEEGSLVRLPEHTVTLKPKESEQRDRLIKLIDEGAFAPPLTAALGAPAALLRALTESGELVKIGDFYLTARRAEEARGQVRRLIEVEGPATIAQIRDALATSRKYAVPLCEWLDSTGATKRQGDVRALGSHP